MKKSIVMKLLHFWTISTSLGHIKVLFYIQINLHCLSPYGRNCNHYAREIMKNWKIMPFQDEAWVLSNTWYIYSRYCRNKLICLCGFCIELLFAENWLKITCFFLIWSNPAINERKAHGCSLYSDVVWLSFYEQCKFHKDLSFLSIKLSGIKFLPRLSETKQEVWLSITPNFGAFSKLFWLHATSCYENFVILTVNYARIMWLSIDFFAFLTYYSYMVRYLYYNVTV